MLEANGRSVETWGLLDKCSDTSIIDEILGKELLLEGPEEPLQFNTVYGTGSTRKCKRVSFTLSSRDRCIKVEVTDAKMLPELKIVNKCRQTIANLQQWPHLTDLPMIRRPETIPLIIGRDVEVHDIIEVRKPPHGQEGPSAEKTVFGWCVVGKAQVTKRNPSAVSTFYSTLSNTDERLHELVYRFQTTESFGVKVADLRVPAEVERSRRIFQDTTRLLANGHYE